MSVRPEWLLFLWAALLPAAAPLWAEDISLSFPLDCALGKSCYIQHYVDREPGPGLRDYGCGSATYEGHDGTDFALPTRAAMEAGVHVLAAAPGKVRAVRDGEPDGAYLAGADVAQKECGNGVLIEHGDGWQTQYCHLKTGSVRVSPGQDVAAGTPLGLVGLSGMSEFPHLHLAVRLNGQELDPFLPVASESCAVRPEDDLWQDSPDYNGGGLLQVGLAGAAPDYGAVKAGVPEVQTLPDEAAPALLLWAYGHGSRAGDILRFAISGPEGFSFRHEAVLEKPQALYYRYAGKRRPAQGFAAGDYSADVWLLRDGRELAHKSTRLRLEN